MGDFQVWISRRGKERTTHLEFQSCVIQGDGLGEDAGPQCGLVFLMKHLMHILVKEGGLPHTDKKAQTHMNTRLQTYTHVPWHYSHQPLVLLSLPEILDF